MARKERLPKYVSSFIDNRGTRRYRFRKGVTSRYFIEHPNTVSGAAEYEAFLSGVTPERPNPRVTIRGSVDALLTMYYGSTDFRGRAQDHTLADRMSILEEFRAKHGHRIVKDARYDKLDKYIADIAKGSTDEKGRKRGGPFAAETARKLIRGMFKYATKLGWRSDNPMDFVGYRPKKTKGFHSWTEGEIEQYRARWPLGTKQRIALELMLWTGKRRSDAVVMGPQHIEDGELRGRDIKTGKPWTLPIAPQLRTAIDAMPVTHLCFIPSERGKPYTAASFGDAFRHWCDAAGLPHCTSHGLRKAISRRMAEEGIGNAGIKSVTLHSGDDEVSLYVADANQRHMAQDSIDRISRKELSSAAKNARQSDHKRA